MLDPKKQTPKRGEPIVASDPDPEAYYAVLAPEVKGYSVYFPDVPGCITQGENLHEALVMAEKAVTGWLDTAYDNDIPIPPARGLLDILADDAWAKEHDVDWHTAHAALILVDIWEPIDAKDD